MQVLVFELAFSNEWDVFAPESAKTANNSIFHEEQEYNHIIIYA